jgi:hypothetical protein
VTPRLDAAVGHAMVVEMVDGLPHLRRVPSAVRRCPQSLLAD